MKMTLIETVERGVGGRVDRQACLVRGLRVCGLKSANGRTYSRQALREALKLYEGVSVCVNHPEGESNARRYEDRLGRLVNVRVAPDGALYGDLHYNPHHQFAERFLWDAEHNPRGIGLSHNANGNGRRQPDGTVLVEQITKVHSVDLVSDAATSGSLYEQRRTYRENAMDPISDPAAPVDGSSSIDDLLHDLVAELAAHPTWPKEEKLKRIRAALELMEDDKPASVFDTDDDDGDGTQSVAEMREQREIAKFFANSIDWNSDEQFTF